MPKAGLTYDRLDTAFRHRNFEPLYFFYGEETFLAQELQQTLLQHALEPHERDFNLDLVYGQDAEAPQVLALCAAYPMMAARRVVIVRNFEQLKDNRLFQSYAERPNPQALVVLVCSGKVNAAQHPYRALREHAAWAEFKPFYPREMPGWIQQRVSARGHRIAPAAVQMLADFVGTNLQAAAAEIEKLITYAGGRETLTADDVLHAGGQTREFNVFELQKAIGEGRYGEAVRIAERLVGQASNGRGEALMIVSVLTTYFTRLWKLTVCRQQGLDDRTAAQRVGISPYFIKEYLFSLRRFTPTAIERAFAALLAADYELKGGSTRDERLVLLLLLGRLLPEQARARTAVRAAGAA